MMTTHNQNIAMNFDVPYTLHSLMSGIYLAMADISFNKN